jgi:LmbE family N-acetylglucosaminyl deacetylase
MGLIEGPGTAESVWQRWLPQAGGSAGALPDWMRPSARLVVLAPHPDDEVIACGGLIAMHAARGGQCLVLAATEGEASEAGLDTAAASQLAARRSDERNAGLACLGANEATVRRLSLPDARLADCHEPLQDALRRELRPGDVLLTTWRQDGHPDHEACGRAAAIVAAATGTLLVEAPVWMWHWAQLDDPRVPWARMVSLALPEAVRRRKQDALAAHRSQLTARSNGEAAVLGNDVVMRMQREHEHYFV